MAKFAKLPFNKGELNKGLSGFFKGMLENGAVDAVLVPMAQAKKGVRLTLVTSAASCEQVDPFAPIAAVSGAKIASSMTARPSGRKIAMVLRPCEVRALVELVKLKQANLDDVLLIGMDCLGRYENTDFAKFLEQGGTSETFLDNAQAGKTSVADFDIVGACRICEFPQADSVDLRLCAIGAGAGSVYIEAVTEKGEEVLTKAGLTLADVPAGRDEAVKKLAAARTEARNGKFAEFRSEADSFEKLEEKLSACVNCYNCRVACPVCYCKECVFVTDTFRHSGEQFFTWAEQTGALKLPSDTLFYHLTRMTHMSLFCVGCGQCTSACPNGIDLMPLFRTCADKTQARFNYQAGRSLDEQQPMAGFESDELVEVTGQVN
ncbi:MAG: Coenzyme F420 hydrogenase/dehydrogenase, beta subunit C-terminal domain [Desulfobacteraceae bacterium]|nr:Coenzyme F420 hydrogenase/dehydrogenase, beta subunit C-terminal domain [Desulfobacteraceae bacterium]